MWPVLCSSCGTLNEIGRKFCGECGSRLAAGCPSCGTQNAPGTKFCGECGTRLDAGGPATAVGSPLAGGQAGQSTVGAAGSATGGTTERRLVSVLFADLVGFTARSDGADPEQVRDFLSVYFETARSVVERYGGTVEKFIGDAVMAIWGAPVAREDDAERSVRAALELVDAIRHLGRQGGDDELALRAAVLTGEAAVAVGAVGQGMVAGDLVNTASRLQGVAAPGTVLVGEATRRAASESILFEDVGPQQLKGVTAALPAWRALRVRKLLGADAGEGIEAPFVGRDDELRLLKDFLHASANERHARLISVTGQAGIGKSRLARELRKYIDGITEGIYVHVGRSPAFGDGVTFWALGEMVRMRAGLVEGDDEVTTRQSITAILEEYVVDEAERARIEPALLSLLGVAPAPPGGRDALFAAWRSLFEQISLQGTTLLIFEDLQWADAGLLDFIDHLLEWSVGYPILVIGLARPELLERRPTFGAGRRNFVALSLSPLSDDAMREMLSGLVPGLPPGALKAILDRAGGIPLYAVETVRMLVEEGRLAEEEGAYRVVDQLGDLHVPETLHALIAARLDAVEPADRSLLQDAAVLGQTFTIAAIAALTGEPPEALEPRLRGLAHRELLVLDTDPRSPERGQYGFTQALVREVAYGTLAKKDRRDRHLAAARYFEALDDEEVAGVLATHYVSAFEAAPVGAEADALASQARIALRAAAERAAVLGSKESAIAYWERARTVTSDPADETEIIEKVAVAARDLGRFEAAEAHFREAIQRWTERGERLAAARATMGLGRTLGISGRMVEALDLTRAAEASVADLAPDPVLIDLWLGIGSATFALGDPIEAMAWTDKALTDAERLRDVPLVASGIVNKGGLLSIIGRVVEGRALLETGMQLGEKIGDGLAATRASHNLAVSLMDDDPVVALGMSRRALELASRYGYASMRLGTLANAVEASLQVGDWEWLYEELAGIRLEDLEPADRAPVLVGLIELRTVRGEDAGPAERELLSIAAQLSDPVAEAATAICLSLARVADGRFEEAHEHALVAEKDELNAPYGRLLAARAALRLGDLARARDAIARFDVQGGRGASSDAIRDGLAAVIDVADGSDPQAVVALRDAWARLRALGLDIALALSELDLLAVAPDGTPLLGEAALEARTIFERTGATAYLAQLDAIEAERAGRNAARPSETVGDAAEVTASA